MTEDRTRRFTWAAWVPLLIVVPLATIAIIYWRLADQIGAATDSAMLIGITTTGMLVYATFGGLIARHVPRNPIGWIFGLAAVAISMEGASFAYATYAEAVPGLAASRYAAWLSNWIWLPGIASVGTFLPLHFPNGRLLSARWKPVVWLSWTTIALLVAGGALSPGPLEDFSSVVNPVGVPGPVGEALGTLGAIGYPLLPLCIALSVASLILRARRSGAIEREQIKWIGYVAVFFPVGLANSFITDEFDGLAAVLVFAPLIAIPVASAIAIYRYRLFDIDRLITRTVSYAIITVILGALFVLVALVPTILVGGDDSPDWLIAVATLIIVAFFRPVRRRVQGAVDQRFNRARYNAVQTIEAFNAHLRDEVDLDALRAELRSVVARTMQPTHVSLWVKEQA